MIYVILGQTASGKSKLAHKIAKEFSLPIISADAFQCYKKMDIGTAKPSKKELEEVKYHFIDEYNVDEEISLFLFQKRMREVLDSYIENNVDVIVTGGTLLYIKALLFDYDLKEEEKKERYKNYSLESLQKELKERNIDIYNNIDINNPRRLIRALENLDNGNNIKDGKNNLLYPAIFFQIKVEKEEINQLIDQRVEKMFQLGLEKEVKDLLNKYPTDLKAFQGIGYKDFILGIKDNLFVNDIKTNIMIHTHQYAKRQRTFLNTQFPYQIIESKENIYNYIKNDLLLKKRSKLALEGRTFSKIEKAKVLLCGLGGVGSIVASCLVRLGFKNLYLIDNDKVEPSNLNRQILYDLNDINNKKVEICKKKLTNISPITKIETSNIFVDNVSSLPSDKFDIIIDCIDSVDGKLSLYLKSKEDNSIFITACGSGFHLDSTKFVYGKLNLASDKLASNFKLKLKEEGIDEELINNINCVYAKDNRIKSKPNCHIIPSICSATNACGLAIISLLLKILKEEK